MKMVNCWYGWYQRCATAAEKQLIDKVCDSESLFEDMLFRQGTSTHALIQCQTKSLEGGEWRDDELPLPEELAYFGYEFFYFKVEPLDECDGMYNHSKQTLTIAPQALERDSVILHELIHLHESVINEFPLYFHDMVFWALYKDLKEKIPDLDAIISGHAHLLTGSTIYSDGGLHDILFLLKSFDLDIRKEWPLGTVFAYGRDDELKGYTYKKGSES